MQKNIAKFALLACVLLCFSAFIGCAKSDGLNPVEGTVTLDGVPVADGNINFGPMAGQSGTATGGKITDGKYSIRASQGEMAVTIRAPKKETVDQDGHQAIQLTETIPEKYNMKSELKVTINPGKNTGVNFDLKSDSAE